jgi:hypothetical protein
VPKARSPTHIRELETRSLVSATAPRRLHKPPSLSYLYRMMGRLGKENMHRIGFLSYTTLQAVVALMAAATLAACAGGQTVTYVGHLTALAGTCDATNRATLQRHGTAVQFTPQDGVLVLEGTVSAGGAINASTQTTGMDRKPYNLSFRGQIEGGSVSGTYASSRCRYGVQLQAVPN